MSTTLHEHFQDLGQQSHAAHFGMWVFLGSEALLFSGLFTLYAAGRVAYPVDFADGAGHTNLALGTAMTIVLIVGSYLVALGVHAVRGGRPSTTAKLFAAAAAVGVLFLGLKGWEYTLHFRDGIYPGPAYHYDVLPGVGARYFFTLYYLATGLHALHVLGGVAVLAIFAKSAHAAGDEPYATPFELGGMYWHFVDIIWLFLWPLFYLLR